MRPLPPLAAALAALALAAAAEASSAPPVMRERVAVTAAGRAAARAAVVSRSDLGSGGGWSGGPSEMGPVNPPPPCPPWLPRRSDLVLVGRAQTTWSAGWAVLTSHAEALATARMVRLDWRRTVVAPQTLPCMRAAYGRIARGVYGRVLSLRSVAVPRIGDAAVLYRAETAKRLVVDSLAISAGRIEISLTTTAAWPERRRAESLALRLGRLLAARAR